MATNTSARESDVGKLHSAVNTMYLKISNRILAMLDSDEEAEQLIAMSAASPAMLTAMQNWVKQNDVSCIPDEIEETAKATKEILSKREKRGSKLLQLAGSPSKEAKAV